MSFPRIVQNETLDHLPGNDPRAMRSRQDLQRINRLMGSKLIMLHAIRNAAISPPRRILELGAGDGTLMLSLAQSLAPKWPKVRLGLLDKQNLVTPQTLHAIQRLGWQPEIIEQDVLDWAAQPYAEDWDLVLANLFIHHFEGDDLQGLLAAISSRCKAFIACEPRRSKFALSSSRMVSLLGANDVTQEDAVLSVQAGFCKRELSSLWPHRYRSWNLRESEAGLFSHCFSAVRA
ncbi:MAG TPA: hypothetical protein VEA39_00275 [Methylophilaceae bacterium]|nr:hypothetical protein [Methylophilaceae bacterium]